MSSEPTRPSTSKKRLIQLMVVGGVALVGYGVYRYAVRVIRQDPLASYKKTHDGELPDTVAIQSNDSVFNHFEDGKPQASCNVKEMQIAQNRQVYNFQGITNGKLEWKGATYQFAANTGSWNGFVKKLQLQGNLKLKGDKFDLSSKEMTYDEVRRSFIVPQEVVGTAYDGKLQVATFAYDMDHETMHATKGTWIGKPTDKSIELPAQDKQSTWSITFEDMTRDHDVSKGTNGWATDGDVIVKAPKMELNHKTDVLTATGRVQYFGREANLIADKIVVYRKEKRAVLTGNVTMLVKPKAKADGPPEEAELTPLPPAVPESISATRPPAPDDTDTQKKTEEQIRSMKNLREYPLVVTAPSIEYWYKKGERHAKITGNPQGRQELPDGWRYVWSDHANYDGEKEILSLFSAPDKMDVILKNSLGDEMYGTSGELSTKDGDDWYHFSKGKGKLTTSGDDDIPTGKGGDKKGGGGTTGGGGKGGGGGLSGPIGHGV
ncbi:MAG: hypothetical protein JST51_05280 [Armatimonadetes bacterium]|nr:hypothetical protein [Armatimonadota bacterium]